MSNSDFEMLKRIAQKVVEPMDENSDPNKTIGQWQAEMAALLNEVVFYVSSQRRS